MYAMSNLNELITFPDTSILHWCRWLGSYDAGFKRMNCLFIDVINVYNVYRKFFVNAFIILSTFISIKITWLHGSY